MRWWLAAIFLLIGSITGANALLISSQGTASSPTIVSVTFYSGSCTGTEYTSGNPASFADDSSSGTAIADVCVTMSNSGSFDGTLSITSQTVSGLVQLSGNSVQVDSVSSSDDGDQSAIIQATPGSGEGGSAVSGTLYMDVTSSADLRTAFSLPTGDVVHYISTTGSDSNNGTSPSTAWATPNHAVNCGDVILVEPGSYTTQFGNGSSKPFGAVSGCPSTSGGIDGTGGIYFAVVLCAGTDLESCKIACSCASSVDVAQTSNWAIEGFKATTPYGGSGVQVSFLADSGVGTDNCSGTYGHIAFINDVSYTSGDGFTANDCGSGGGSLTPGEDYEAIVGDIAQSSNSGLPGSGYCVAQIDLVGMANTDTNAGTHGFVYNNYAYAGLIPTGCLDDYDGEGFMFDSLDAHLITGVFSNWNNIAYDNSRSCFQIDQDAPGGTYKQIYVNFHNITCYHNYVLGSGAPDSTGAEFNQAGNGSTDTAFNIRVFNNLAPEYNKTSQSADLYSSIVGGTEWHSWEEGTSVGAGLQNDYYDDVQTTCDSGSCAPSSSPYAETIYNSNPVPTNTQNIFGTDPAYQDTTDLLANAVGIPNCTGFQNTTECMGWDTGTTTLTIPAGQSCPSGYTCTTIGSYGTAAIYDLMPTASDAAGKGYQIPSTTCGGTAVPATITGTTSGTTLTVTAESGQPIGVGMYLVGASVGTVVTAFGTGSGGTGTYTISNSQTATITGGTDYPSWLKGIVYLHWDGTNLWEYNDLVTKPCGM